MMFHGLVLIDKPSGITSHDVVAKVRRAMGTKAVGHCGTLDPLASGLMVLLINEATKLSQYILEQDKGYELEAKLGITTDSFDITGNVTKESQNIPEMGQTKAQVNMLCGAQLLPVPVFSAVKIDGKKLYEYAREGEEIQVPTREMIFHEVALLGQTLSTVNVRIKCSKGTYIRAWVQKLGENLGCGAVMTGLRRTFSAPYILENAVQLDQLEGLVRTAEFSKPCFIPIEAALPQAKFLRVKGQDEVMLGNGLISYDLRSRLIFSFQPEVDTVLRILSQDSGRLLALVGLEPGKGFSLKRVFRYS